MASIEFVFKKIDALRRAVEARGLKMRKDNKYKWFGRWVGDYHAKDAAYKRYDPKMFGKNAEWVIYDPKAPNAYEIGVVVRPEGDGYDLLMDFYGSQGEHIAKKAGGRKLGHDNWSLHEGLIQDYSVEAVKETEDVMALKMLGYVESQTVDQETGDIILTYEN